MKLFAAPRPDGTLAPCSEADLLLIKKLKLYKPIEIEVTKKRNIKFHRKFFALLQALMNIEEIEDTFENIKKLRYALTMSAGYFEIIPSFKGEETYVPTSISFASMDQTEFDLFYAKIIRLVLARLNQYCEDDLNAMVNEVLTFA